MRCFSFASLPLLVMRMALKSSLSFLAMQLNIHDKNVQDYGAGGILVEKHLMQDKVIVFVSFASHLASD